MLVASVLGGLLVVAAPNAYAAGGYDNAAIADKALSYVGRQDGAACQDAQKPGDTGGQCRAFVNCIVWMVSGRAQNLGGRDYFQPFLAAGGTEVRDLDELRKGGIVQDGQGTHTFIIVGRVSGNTFDVVDSNHKYDETVMHYYRTVGLDATNRAFRMGTATGPPPGGEPFGHLDEVRPVPGGANIRGWAIDPDIDAPIQVHFYGGDGAAKPGVNPSLPLTANASRPTWPRPTRLTVPITATTRSSRCRPGATPCVPTASTPRPVATTRSWAARQSPSTAARPDTSTRYSRSQMGSTSPGGRSIRTPTHLSRCTSTVVTARPSPV
jgi:hypothetical protein